MAARNAAKATIEHPEKSDPADDAAPAAEQEATPGFIVTAGACVLRTSVGDDRYLYRGAPVDEAVYSQASVKHACEVGLISKIDE